VQSINPVFYPVPEALRGEIRIVGGRSQLEIRRAKNRSRRPRAGEVLGEEAASSLPTRNSPKRCLDKALHKSSFLTNPIRVLVAVTSDLRERLNIAGLLHCVISTSYYCEGYMCGVIA